LNWLQGRIHNECHGKPSEVRHFLVGLIVTRLAVALAQSHSAVPFFFVSSLDYSEIVKLSNEFRRVDGD
jgi:hypothetical protein